MVERKRDDVHILHLGDGPELPALREAAARMHIEEHVTFPGRLRTRLGTFVEPSPFPDTSPRPHVTGGFELFLFNYLEAWALSASFDVARRYSNFGVSVGFWR